MTPALLAHRPCPNPSSLSFLCTSHCPSLYNPCEVMNFYEMRAHTHLRTIAAMDELELLFLPAKQASALLGLTSSAGGGGKGKKGQKQAGVGAASASHHVLVCAGTDGATPLFHVHYQTAPKAGKGSNAAPSFSCTLCSPSPLVDPP